MTPNEIAGRAAEAVMRKIEDTRRINKREITEAIEGVLLVHQMQTSVFSMWGAYDRQHQPPDVARALWGDSDDSAFRAYTRILCGND